MFDFYLIFDCTVAVIIHRYRILSSVLWYETELLLYIAFVILESSRRRSVDAQNPAASAMTKSVWHRFFKEQRAPVPFVCSEAVGKYVNKVWISPLTAFMARYWTISLLQALSRRPGKGTPSISLPNDLSIYHSEISMDNFLFDITTRRICIVGFQHSTSACSRSPSRCTAFSISRVPSPPPSASILVISRPIFPTRWRRPQRCSSRLAGTPTCVSIRPVLSAPKAEANL